MGLLLGVIVHAANIQDGHGVKLLLTYLAGWLPRLMLIRADGGYRGKLVRWVAVTLGWTLDTVKRTDDMVGVEIQPRLWVVERTLAWLGRYHRLSKDYKELEAVSEGFFSATMIHLMPRMISTIIPYLNRIMVEL